MLTPKNWASFQHYKDRAPAWIKLHKGLLDDFEFSRLPLASRALAPLLWLLASEYTDGQITADVDELAFRLRMPADELRDALSPLIDAGFFHASEPLAERKHDAIPEKRRDTRIEAEEEKKETRSSALVVDDGWPADFREQFWSRYPNKVGKPKALAKLEGVRRRGAQFSEIMAGLDAYIRSKPPDRAWLNPETFINQERWTDQPALVSQGSNNAKRTVHDAARDLHERVKALDAVPGELRDGTRDAPVRLLSSR